MTLARTVLLILHILSAGIWISQAAVALVLGRIIHNFEGKPNELTLWMARGMLVGTMGAVGGLGILITGFGLIGVDGYGFLGLGGSTTPAWLFIKQAVYLVILAIVFGYIRPASNKVRAQLAAAAQGATTITPELRSINAQLETVGLIQNLLVLVNITLAVWKPA